MFPGRPWDCGKTFEKVFRLLHPLPLPFLSALRHSISLDGIGTTDRPLADYSRLVLNGCS